MKRVHVALLRGINVGRAKRVPMAELRALVEALGYGDVRTLLNSGNVVFTGGGGPERARAGIEAALVERLGVASRVTVLTAGEVEAMVAGNPFGESVDNPSRLLIAVLADRADRTLLEPLLDDDWGTDRFALGERVAYLWCPAGVLESRLPEAVARLLGDAVTTRNWATMTKLHALAAATGRTA